MKECQQCKRCYTDEVAICPEDGMPTFHSIPGEPILEAKYKLEKRLGQGGMGVVYCAKHSYLKTQHAIKVILPDLVGNDPQLVTRFRQEALAAAAIRHHNVIAVTDFGVVQGKMPFLVMEFVEGESLHELLAREKRLTSERAVELISAVAAGVGAAHRQGIVHRDLKPLNVMICKDKHSMSEAVKILDFGLAKIKSGELLGSFIQAQTTGLMGSPYYMAPEQWADEEPDAQADIYSLAVMFFQMIAGDVPFKGSSIPAIMKKHLSDPPPSFAEMGANITPQLEIAVRRALEKDRHKRTQEVGQFVDELQMAIGYSLSSMHTTGGTGSLPVSTLHILSHPPQSSVFVDNVSVGKTQENGWLLLEGLQSGNHLIRVSHEGYADWQNEVFFDGKPQQVVAELKLIAQHSGINHPESFTANTVSISPDTPQSSFHNRTVPPPQQTFTSYEKSGRQDSLVPVSERKSVFSPLLMAIIGVSGLLLLSLVGVVGAYWLGIFGKTTTANVNQSTPTPRPPTTSTPSPEQNPPTDIKADMVKIAGGTFTMGQKDKGAKECEHQIQVGDFWIDKTEVTNAEYQKFIEATNHSVPEHWKGNKFPPAGKENFPVVFVNQGDAIQFAKWRSTRDGAEYRLPSEAEWEYAARNGGKNSIYPWGNLWENNRAVLKDTEAKPVGSLPEGKNDQGVLDLIGNVWEWTSSNLKPYPCAEMKEGDSKNIVVRGGSYSNKETTATSRGEVKADRKDASIGFRLVRQ